MRLRAFVITSILLTAGVLFALSLRGRLDSRGAVQAVRVPRGDQEVAWLHTSTSYAGWERFVAGAKRARRSIPGLEVDDAGAYPERSTDVPEVVLSMPGHEGKIRFRWYKLSDAANSRDWVRALAEREPAPLAIVGGDTSDRARDLSDALAEQRQWHGSPPLFFITTATVDDFRPEKDPDKPPETPLLMLYPGRSFRFCFSNRQMAHAVYDFVWRDPRLRPRGAIDGQLQDYGLNPLTLPAFGLSPWTELMPKAALLEPQPGKCFVLGWKDDPYSADFNDAFYAEVYRGKDGVSPRSYQLNYSVGSFDQANRHERRRAEQILDAIPPSRFTRTLLVLPGGVRSARRFLRTMTGDAPLIGRRLVVATGDSISFNTVYRDGEIQWNVRDLPVPIVFFAHQNPIAWDDEFPPPNGTDELLQFDEMTRVLVEGCYRPGEPLLDDSDKLIPRLRQRNEVPVFDEMGNRQSGGEHIIHLRPEIRAGGRVQPTGCLDVWRRSPEGKWQLVRPRPLVAPAPDRDSLDCEEEAPHAAD